MTALALTSSFAFNSLLLVIGFGLLCGLLAITDFAWRCAMNAYHSIVSGERRTRKLAARNFINSSPRTTTVRRRLR